MKVCTTCHQHLPKDKFSKKQWKLGANCLRKCISCVRIVSANNNNRVASSLDSMSIEKVPSPSDKDLFKQPPQKEDCPICFIRMPSIITGHKYKSCCGKVICSGCIYAVRRMSKGALCPFCRTPTHTSDREMIKRNIKRIDLDDHNAIYNVGCRYSNGTCGLPRVRAKALELYLTAGELGCAYAYQSIGNAYLYGDGVQRDTKKAQHYWGLAAMMGHVEARYNLGIFEKRAENMERALKHWTISASSGDTKSLDRIKDLYTVGHATKDDYTTALRTYQAYLDEIRSDQRDEAATYDDMYKYY